MIWQYELMTYIYATTIDIKPGDSYMMDVLA